MGSFIALPAFQADFGEYDPVSQKNIIAAKWQSAFQAAGPLGALVGVCLAGPITSRIGYRWATIGGLMVLNGFIFIFYYANSLPIMFVAQLLEGIPWGIFIANAPAYCSEITPIQLRAPATQMLQMFWAIGAMIVGGVTYHYSPKLDDTAYRCVKTSQGRAPQLLTEHLEFPLQSNGCSLRLLPSSSSWHPNLRGGWCARVDTNKLSTPSAAWAVAPV